MLNTFATTISKIVHSYSLPPHTCDAVSNKIAWLRIFLALPSYKLSNKFENTGLFKRHDLSTSAYRDVCHICLALIRWV